ncbi:MAG: hypothetical protein GF390_01420 [Candidatus Pacebacteria bacterium]|nr:hypothetical protein [Candidatus Paceibacterota bacterium]
MLLLSKVSMPDKYTATWVSHTSINDFLQCPRAYYLKNVYKDPHTNHKIQLMTPPLALGQAVHEVVESLSVLPTEKRFQESLIAKLDQVWSKITGKKGGFSNQSQEQRYKNRAEEMLRRIMDNPGPLNNLAVKIKADLPQFWLSSTDEIILCGKIDWLEYLPDEDSVHIIDFKTGKNTESEQSLQLPIYHLLVHHTQKRPVSKASYWYLANSDKLEEKKLPDLDQAHEQVITIAKKIKTARKLNHFKCPKGDRGCFACQPMEKIIQGEAVKVGVNDFNQDIYVLNSTDQQPASEQSYIL